MVGILQIPKRFGTYADTALVLSLARLAQRVQEETQEVQEIHLKDVGNCYQIQFKAAVDLDEVAALDYWQLFPPVQGGKTDMGSIPVDQVDVFDVVKHKEDRDRYRAYKYQGGKKLDLGDDAPEPPDPRTQNGLILVSMRHDRNHNDLWKSCWELRDQLGALVASILQAFDRDISAKASTETVHIAELFKQRTGKTLPAPASAVKLFMPTAVQGVTRLKADSNKSSDSQKEDWVLLWLIAGGLFEFGLAERIKISDNTFDWRVVVLQPKEISLFRYGEVLKDLRSTDPPSGVHGIARFDAEMVLKFCRKLLNYHPAKEQAISSRMQRFQGQSVKNLVSGFSGTHFGSKGQVYGVKDIFSLGLPDWVRPNTLQEIDAYQEVLREHLTVVRSLSLDEGHTELLAAYRDFITSSDLYQFFRFQVSYADYVTKQFADRRAKYRPQLFSQEGLDIMAESLSKDLKKITENPGFIRVARAINSSTVYAGTIKDKEGKEKTLDWDRVYGLAQRLSNCAASKTEFTAELMAFLARYEDENFRLQSRGKEVMRVWTRKEDLDHIVALIEEFPPSLVANLLIAYGYARWKKPLQGEPPGAIIDYPDDNQDDTGTTSEDAP